MSLTLDQLVYGVRMVETSGRADGYSTVNSIGAVGAYQVMKANVPSWTREALGKAMTWQEFRDSPKAQDAVARYKLGGYLSKYGAEGAAAMWFSGQPNPNSKASDGGNTVRQYVDKVVKFATGKASSAAQAAAAMPTLGRSVYTAQQAGYAAAPKTGTFGAPVNPYKLPGWIASQNQSAGGGAAQAGFGDGGGLVSGGIVPWDGVSTVILSTIFVLGGLGLVVVGLTNAVSPTVGAARDKVTSALIPGGKAAGAAAAAKGAA
ncbi:hypothetical protein [Streptomyces griseoaurantiacus]|uniref:hypothetical protein n=1 Tax=Streptomyces griseoaurantiacus TaxID=68213 RepID=UPI0030DF3746